ncbi:hypothetical protein HWV62_16670 [Athelia sp. TMB]|nr:hypothetical protein HWV62_16670 [Athelia sp. TMB]
MLAGAPSGVEIVLIVLSILPIPIILLGRFLARRRRARRALRLRLLAQAPARPLMWEVYTARQAGAGAEWARIKPFTLLVPARKGEEMLVAVTVAMPAPREGKGGREVDVHHDIGIARVPCPASGICIDIAR